MGFSRHEFPPVCCVCFNGLTIETCAVDKDGVKWDACPGECARAIGLEEICSGIIESLNE